MNCMYKLIYIWWYKSYWYNFMNLWCKWIHIELYRNSYIRIYIWDFWILTWIHGHLALEKPIQINESKSEIMIWIHNWKSKLILMFMNSEVKYSSWICFFKFIKFVFLNSLTIFLKWIHTWIYALSIHAHEQERRACDFLRDALKLHSEAAHDHEQACSKVATKCQAVCHKVPGKIATKCQVCGSFHKVMTACCSILAGQQPAKRCLQRKDAESPP